MREGINPQKSQPKLEVRTNHRVIFVVYLSDQYSFYENSLDVFKLALDSAITTINNNAAITVVNNGSMNKVGELLDSYYKSGKIDTLISHRQNIGKIDALLGAARSSREKYITLSDADVLFKAGWQQEVEKVFHSFPDTGSVSLISYRHNFWHATSTVMRQILSGKLKLKKEAIPENFEDYKRFTQSINKPFDDTIDAPWPIVESQGNKAIVGGTHQVITVDRDVFFQTIPTQPSYILIGKNSVVDFIDEPIDRAKKLRLSTFHNYAYHMGNGLEDWMLEIQRNNESSPKPETRIIEPITNDLFSTPNQLRLYRIQKRYVRRWFFKIKKIGKYFPKKL